MVGLVGRRQDAQRYIFMYRKSNFYEFRHQVVRILREHEQRSSLDA